MRDTVACQGSLQFLMRRTERQPPFGLDGKRLPGLTKFPFRQFAARITATNAIMGNQVGRRLRCAVLRKIGRCGDDRVTQWLSQRYRNHVRRQVLAKADACVKPLVDNIDQRRIGYDFDFDLGVGLHKAQCQRTQHVIHRRTRRVDPQRS